MAWKKTEYRKFRVRTPIKSFRDLEVYKKTTELSADLYLIYLEIKKDKEFKDFKEEFEKLVNISKYVPKLIAESYGDRFSDFLVGLKKLEKTMSIISNVIAKADYIIYLLKDQNLKEQLSKTIGKYQTQRVKINNLRNAWERTHGEMEEKKLKTKNV